MGYLGVRTLLAFLSYGALGAILYLSGTATGSVTLKGIGIFFGFGGAVLTAGLLLRWLIYRQVR